jgi:NAD(P)-dependent dehydrogenase (short-subunit alcohol dehydrogenase family)
MCILSKGFDEGGLLEGVFECVPPKLGFAAVATVNAAIITLAKAFADKGIKDGVQVNRVVPGAITHFAERGFAARCTRPRSWWRWEADFAIIAFMLIHHDSANSGAQVRDQWRADCV